MNKHSIKIVKLSILLVIGISFASCNGLFKNNTPYYKVSALMKQYCYFDAGSKWVYLNDSTGAFDTLEIDNVSSFIAFHSQDPTTDAFSYDAIEMNFKSNVFDFSKGGLYAGAPADNNTASDMYRIFYTGDTTFQLALAPGYAMGESQILGGQEGIYTNVETISNMTLNGIDFSDVYHTEEKVAPYGGDTTRYEFYFAPKYGLVKWTKSFQGNTESYSLKAAYLKQQ